MIQNNAVAKFLETRKPGTKAIYTYGLLEFQQYYQPQGTVENFIDRVQEDLKHTDWREKQKVAQNVLKGFSGTLQAKRLAPKTVRTYVSAVQSLLKFYLETTVPLFSGTVPSSRTQSRPYEWTLEPAGKFIHGMNNPMYRSLAALLFQSGLGPREALSLEYLDIKEEYEKNVVPLCLDFGLEGRKKTGYPFLTFIGYWAVRLLRDYLETTQMEGRLYPVAKESVDLYFRVTAKQFLGTWNGRNPCRPHSLRTGFKTIATDAKVIDSLYVEFFMGHAKQGKNVEETYISKSREAWRQTYSKLEPFLTPKLGEGSTQQYGLEESC